MKSTMVSVLVGIVLIAGYYVGKRYFLKPNIKQGVEAAEIEASLPDGTPFRLSQLSGHYILLDFWGSWCKPCRQSNPELVKLYDRFKNESFADAKGFQIVSYAFDGSRDAWASAIAKDSLNWPYHLIATDMFDSPVAKAFNVKQIPTKFLINPEGKIIAVDPSIGEVIKLLEQRSDKTKGQ